MTVHANSVISTWLNNYYPAAYTAITSQENFAYTTDTVAKWQGYFNELDYRMGLYHIAARASVFYDFMSSYYAYYLLNQMYGADGSSLSAGDGYTVFSMNGFITAALGRATSYYGDWVTAPGTGASFTAHLTGGVVTSITGTGGTAYVTASTRLGMSGGGGQGAYATTTASAGILQTPTVLAGGSGYVTAPTVTVTVGTTVKLSADVTTVNGAVAAENITIGNLSAIYRSTSGPVVTRLLFEDVIPLTTLSKAQLVTQFFTTLHYKPVYQYLNMAPLTLPPGA